MLKTMKRTNAPREGRGVPLQRQNPKNFLVVVVQALSAVSEGSKDPSFLRRKCIQEVFAIRFPDDEDYNQQFTTAEFEHAIRNCKNTSPGEDKIHYAMVNHLGTR